MAEMEATAAPPPGGGGGAAKANGTSGATEGAKEAANGADKPPAALADK